jgi:glutamine amidotransferase
MSAPPEIALVDYGAGNLRSVAKALERSGLKVAVTSDPEALPRASAVVLPGVGNFSDAAARLRAQGLDERCARAAGALLGLVWPSSCSRRAMSTDDAGFAWLRGKVARFRRRRTARRVARAPHRLEPRTLPRRPPDARRPPGRGRVLLRARCRALPTTLRGSPLVDYGGDFAAAVADEGIFAVQFHPEKSQWAGKRLLDSFAAWVRSA